MVLQVMPNSATSTGHRLGQADQAMNDRHVGLGHDRLDEVERGRHVDRDDRIPLRLGKRLDWCEMLDAVVVDDDVDLAELGAGKLGHGANLLGLAHVGARVTRLHAELPLQRGARELDLVRVAEAIEHDIGPLFGQGTCDRLADAAGRPGDDV